MFHLEREENETQLKYPRHQMPDQRKEKLKIIIIEIPLEYLELREEKRKKRQAEHCALVFLSILLLTGIIFAVILF